jgi:hypothetical protein
VCVRVYLVCVCMYKIRLNPSLVCLCAVEKISIFAVVCMCVVCLCACYVYVCGLFVCACYVCACCVCMLCVCACVCVCVCVCDCVCVCVCVCLCDGDGGDMVWGGLTVNFPFLGVNVERYIDVFERPSPHTLYAGTVGVKSEIISPTFHPLGEC